MAEPRALLLINRHCRLGENDLQPVLNRFTEHGIVIEQVRSSEPEAAAIEIRRRTADFDLLVIGGGDGTLRTAAATVLESGLPLGILPLGTANDLAHSLGIPIDPIAAVDVIANAALHRIDLGQVNGHYFFNAAHIGLGASVSHRLSHDRKQRWGVLSYARSIFEAWRDVRPFMAEMDCDGQIYFLRSIQITIGNGRFFGGGMTVHQDALIDDQQLDVYSMQPQSLWHIAAQLPALRAGQHESLAEVSNYRGKRIVIRTRRPKPITADGDLITQTPAVFEVVPAAVAVYAAQSEQQAEGLSYVAH